MVEWWAAYLAVSKVDLLEIGEVATSDSKKAAVRVNYWVGK